MLPVKDQGGLMRSYFIALSRCSFLAFWFGPVRQKPLVQKFHSAFDRYPGAPPGCLSKTRRVADIVLLVADPARPHCKSRLGSANLANQLQQLKQADRIGGPPADVKCASGNRTHVFLGQQQRSHQVLDIKHVSHLHSIPIDCDRLPFNGTDQKTGHPSLVFISELVGTINATHPEDDRGNSKRSDVIQRSEEHTST